MLSPKPKYTLYCFTGATVPKQVEIREAAQQKIKISNWDLGIEWENDLKVLSEKLWSRSLC